jgi:hypothetical protein
VERADGRQRDRSVRPRQRRVPRLQGPELQAEGADPQALRARQGHDLPRQGQEEGQVPQGRKARISKKGRFTKRFTVRHPGTYRLRYVYKGNSTVAGGRVTEAIKITRHLLF